MAFKQQLTSDVFITHVLAIASMVIIGAAIYFKHGSSFTINTLIVFGSLYAAIIFYMSKMEMNITPLIVFTFPLFFTVGGLTFGILIVTENSLKPTYGLEHLLLSWVIGAGALTIVSYLVHLLNIL